MTDDRQSTDADPDADERGRSGPVGTVVGATLGPLGAALGTVVDDTRFALRLSLGGGRTDVDAAAGADDGAFTTIEMEDADADEGSGEADAGVGPGETDAGADDGDAAS